MGLDGVLGGGLFTDWPKKAFQVTVVGERAWFKFEHEVRFGAVLESDAFPDTTETFPTELPLSVTLAPNKLDELITDYRKRTGSSYAAMEFARGEESPECAFVELGATSAANTHSLSLCVDHLGQALSGCETPRVRLSYDKRTRGVSQPDKA